MPMSLNFCSVLLPQSLVKKPIKDGLGLSSPRKRSYEGLVSRNTSTTVVLDDELMMTGIAGLTPYSQSVLHAGPGREEVKWRRWS